MVEKPLGVQISHFLKSRGVDVIFGIPGVHNQELYRGIEEAGIVHVLARHEQGAGFMADGYARATGKPGVAYVITGPGLCNILTPLGQAYSDSVPVLTISSCLDEVAARRGQLHQMLDQEGAGASVCEWSQTAWTPEAAYGLLDRAFAEFETKRKRPKHIQVPISALEGRAPEYPERHKVSSSKPSVGQNLAPVISMLETATKPLLILGGGAAGAELSSFLSQCNIAVMSTFAGRGIVLADYPLFMGSPLTRPESVTAIAQADLVIAVGTELAEVDLWRAKLGHTAPLIRVDIDPEVLSDQQNADVKLCMDAALFFEALEQDAERLPKSTGWSEKDIKELRALWRSGVDAEFPNVLPVVEALRQAMPQETMIYSDMTQFAYLAKEVWDMPRPNHWHHPSGFGTLGYALPAAIGGAMARPGLPTVAIAGDYGFQYTLPELGTAVELGLSLPIFVWDNQKLKAIEDSMIGAQIAPNAVQCVNPDFLSLARAYGAHAARPNSLSEVQDCLNEALAADRPTVIHLSAERLSV